jgi:hypothetical protein
MSNPCRAVSDWVHNMIEYGSGTRWVSIAQAARALGITETAVRKRVKVGALSSRGQRGATEVLIQVENDAQEDLQPGGAQVQRDSDALVIRMAGELGELRLRLADAKEERDRWHAAAIEAREEARAARSAREAVERELRIVLSRQ